MFSACQSQLQSYIDQGNKVYHATIGPKNALYLPAGTVFAEAIVGAATVLGFRLTVFAPDDVQCITRLSEIAADTTARGKDGSVQQAVVSWLSSLATVSQGASGNSAASTVGGGDSVPAAAADTAAKADGSAPAQVQAQA